MISVYRGKTLIGDAVSSTSRALWYGEGTFTTARIARGRALFLSRHLDRMLGTLAHFRWGKATREDLLFAIEHTLRSAEVQDGVLRVLVSSGDGYGMKISGDAEIIVSVTKDGPTAPKGLSIVTAEQPPSPYPAHKLSSYMHHTHLFQMHMELHPNTPSPDEVLRVWEGHVLEGARSNIFAWTGAEMWTPPSRNILNGITRQVVCELLPSLRIPLREHDLTVEDLYKAPVLFLTSSLLGMAPVLTVNGQRVVSDEKAAAIFDAVNYAFQRASQRDN